MIKFFRNIRKTLLNEGKSINYFKYAIGEIVLVVIGILIALSINNWNEQQKIKKEESAILESLYENLILAKQQSEQLISNERDLINTLLRVLGINSTSFPLDKSNITDVMFRSALWDFESDVPVINTFYNLKNTGKLDLIKDSSLKDKFANLELNLDKLNLQLEDRLDVQQIRIDNVAEHDINFVRLIKVSMPEVNIENEVTNDYNQILSVPRIRNLLGIKLTMTQSALGDRENLDEAINNLIVILETKLNKAN